MIDFAGIRFDRNGILASGILGITASSLVRICNEGAGGAVTKSISLSERTGHPGSVLEDYGSGLVNAVGLSSQSAEKALQEIDQACDADKKIIASIFGTTIDSFRLVAEVIDSSKACAIEMNISCPNVSGEIHTIYGADRELTAAVVKAVRQVVKKPLIVKLTPNTQHIGQIAKTCEDEGADALCAINTVGPGMLIDIYSGKPILYNKTGGLSGPGIFPIAVRCVYDIYQAVKIPVLGMGGIMKGEDAVQMMMAGATLYGAGSVIYYRGMNAFASINNEVAEILHKLNVKGLEDIIGIAHN